MSHLRRRIDRLEHRRSPDLLWIAFRAEDPTPEALAFERHDDGLTVRIGAHGDLDAAGRDPGAFLPPGPEREACRRGQVKIYLTCGPEDL